MTAPRRHRSLMRGVLAALLACSSAAAVVVAQNRDTVWTRVTGDGDTLIVVWHRDHPWDSQLSARGAELVAEYQSGGRGLVREPLGRATSQGDRTLRFQLPENVRSEPMDAICLYLQPLGRQGLLPVRRATGDGSDTARFRYDAWERDVRRRSDAQSARLRIATTERALHAADQQIASQQAELKERGWTSAASCDGISVQPVDVVRPYSAVPVAQQEAVARQICVHRVWYGRRITDRYLDRIAPEMAKLGTMPRSESVQQALALLRSVYTDAFMVPEAALAVLEASTNNPPGGAAAGLAQREAQARAFLRDWDAMSPGMSDYTPHLGEPNDVLDWPSHARDTAFRALGPALAAQLGAEWIIDSLPRASVQDRAGVFGAALDAYSGCVDDARTQLGISFDTWERLRATEPERARLRQEFLAGECRQNVATLERLRAERETLQTQLEGDREVLARADVSGSRGGSQILNAATCAQQ